MNPTTAKTDMSMTRIYLPSAMAELIIITTELIIQGKPTEHVRHTVDVCTGKQTYL